MRTDFVSIRWLLVSVGVEKLLIVSLTPTLPASDIEQTLLSEQVCEKMLSIIELDKRLLFKGYKSLK